MQSQDEIGALLASKAFNTMRFKAFVFESREADSPHHGCMERFEQATSGGVDDVAAVLPEVEKAFKEWLSHD